MEKELVHGKRARARKCIGEMSQDMDNRQESRPVSGIEGRSYCKRQKFEADEFLCQLLLLWYVHE